MKSSREHEAEQDRRQSVKESIAVLKAFAERIIPEIENADNAYKVERTKVKEALLKQINAELPDSDKMKQLPHSKTILKIVMQTTKNHLHYGKIFNELEQLSVYMNNGLVEDSLVYGPLHTVLIEFYEENIDYLKFLRSDEAPYSNVTKLYNTWKSQSKLEVNHHKQEELKKEEQDILNNFDD